MIDAEDKQRIVASGERGMLLIVADGAGAERAGEVASAITVAAMREHVVQSLADTSKPLVDRSSPSTPASKEIDLVLEAAVREAHRRVVAEAASGVNLTGMASTLVAVVLLGTTAHFVEIGDSRIYLYRGGKLTQLSKDQNQAQMLVDAGILTPEDAKASLARNILLQAMGKSEELIIVQRRIPLCEGDRFLLCSDGLTSHIPDEDIAAVLGGTVLLDEACAKLIAMTLERGARDNVTVVVAHVTGPLPVADADADPKASMVTLQDFSFGSTP